MKAGVACEEHQDACRKYQPKKSAIAKLSIPYHSNIHSMWLS